MSEKHGDHADLYDLNHGVAKEDHKLDRPNLEMVTFQKEKGQRGRMTSDYQSHELSISTSTLQGRKDGGSAELRCTAFKVSHLSSMEWHGGP